MLSICLTLSNQSGNAGRSLSNVLLRSIYLFILFNSFLFIQNDKCLLLIPSSRLRALQATDLFIETLINQHGVALLSVSLSWLPRSVLEFS